MIWPSNLLNFLGVRSCTPSIKELYAGIDCALGCLEREERTALLQRYTCGYSDDEIAARSGSSLTTVRNRLCRAKNKLLNETVLPLMIYGKRKGIEKIRLIFALWERSPDSMPLERVFPEHHIAKALKRAAKNTLADVKTITNYQSIFGIGPVYAEVIRTRLIDLKLSRSRPAACCSDFTQVSHETKRSELITIDIPDAMIVTPLLQEVPAIVY